MNIRQVTSEELAAVIETVQGTRPVTIRSRTILDLLKTGNPFGKVIKYFHFNAMIGAIYGNCVNRQRIREDLTPDFTPMPPSWAVKVGKKLVMHPQTRELYCPLKIERTLTDPVYIEAATLVNLTHADFAQWEKDKYEGRQGVTKTIIWRTYKIANILSMTLDRTRYDVVTDWQDIPAQVRPIEAETDFAVPA